LGEGGGHEGLVATGGLAQQAGELAEATCGLVLWQPQAARTSKPSSIKALFFME
jgi:hypothetical protein